MDSSLAVLKLAELNGGVGGDFLFLLLERLYPADGELDAVVNLLGMEETSVRSSSFCFFKSIHRKRRAVFRVRERMSRRETAASHIFFFIRRPPSAAAAAGSFYKSLSSSLLSCDFNASSSSFVGRYFSSDSCAPRLQTGPPVGVSPELLGKMCQCM